MNGNVPIEVDEAAHAAMLDGVIEAMKFGALDGNVMCAEISFNLFRRLHNDCAVFLYLLDTFDSGRPATRKTQSMARSSVISEPHRAGNDLWFTRAGDGVGFWDGDWDAPGEHEVGDYLTWVAELIPQCEVYVGNDGVIYGSW